MSDDFTVSIAVDDLLQAASQAEIKSAAGLGNADNTSDANKPVSTAQQALVDSRMGQIKADNLDANGVTVNFSASGPDLPENAYIENVIVRDATSGEVVDPSYYSVIRSDDLAGTTTVDLDSEPDDPAKRWLKIEGNSTSLLDDVDVIVRYFIQA